MEKIGVFFLHGFLGLPSDWQAVCAEMTRSFDVEYFPVDYLHELGLGPEVSLSEWGENFNSYAKQKKVSRRILVGYSLGGRLAMQALVQQPDLWQKVILISANPGLADDAPREREERAQSDRLWAQRFETEDWPKVMSAWNAQPVFVGSDKEPQRVEEHYQRSVLAQILIRWSLSVQPDMRIFLKSQLDKLIWVTGEQDHKFLAQTKMLCKEWRSLDVCVVAASSHRVLFDQPQKLAEIILVNMRAHPK